MITVHSKPSCVQCTATYPALDNKGMRYEVIDLTAQPAEVVDAFKARGLLPAPLAVTDADTWPGFRPDKAAVLPAQPCQLRTSAL